MNNEENRVTPKLTSNKFDLREVRVHASAVIFKLIDFLKPKNILVYGCDNFNLVKSFEETLEVVRIYKFDPTAEEYNNLVINKVDLVVDTNITENLSEDELIKSLERISKISDNVIFDLSQVAGENEVPENIIKYQKLLQKYFSSLTVLKAFDNSHTLGLTFDLPQEIKNQCKTLSQGEINYIDNLTKLVELLQSGKEIAFMPGAQSAKSVLDWIDCSDNLEYVYCLIGTSPSLTKINTLFEKNIPLFRPSCLLHLRETLICVVAVNPILHGKIYYTMTNLGFKNVFFLSVKAYNEIIEELKKLQTSSRVMQRFMSYVTDKLNRLEFFVEEQNELCAVNTAAFGRYRNFFQGRKIVIVASGPTTSYYKPIADAIHIGVNYAWRSKNIPMDFLFTNDVIGNDKQQPVRMEEGFERIKDRVFIGKRLQHSVAQAFYDYPVDISLKKTNVSVFYVDSLFSYSSSLRIYQDICYHPLSAFRSSVFSAIQFAFFTCPAEIYLVGCDVSDSGHFYEKIPCKCIDVPRIKIGYAKVKAFAEHHYPGTKIISINPVGLKGLFNDVYTDEYKKSLENK